MEQTQDYGNRIPESVRKQGQLAEDFIKKANEPNTEQGSEEEVQENLEANTDQNKEQGQEVQDQPKDDYKHKYEVLQGKYNAEIARLHEQNRQLQQQMHEIFQQQQNQQQPGQQESETKQDLNPDDFAEYGEEFKSLVQNLKQLRDENQQLKQQIGSVSEHQQQTAEQRFWSELSEAVPQWNEINQDQEFLNWLGETNPWTGTTRNDALQDAGQKHDVNRVAAIFNEWINNSDAGAKYRSQPQPQQNEQQQKQKRPQNVQPSKSRSEAQPQDSKPMWNTAQINEFYDKVRRGFFTGREDEQKRLEQDLFAAQREGRIST